LEGRQGGNGEKGLIPFGRRKMKPEAEVEKSKWTAPASEPNLGQRPDGEVGEQGLVEFSRRRNQLTPQCKAQRSISRK